MVYLKIILILGVLWIEGCLSGKAIQKDKVKPITMMDIYSQSMGQSQKDVAQFIEHNLTEQKTFGYVKPYIPVMNGPVVRKVWVPDHKAQDDADVMVAGHWSYVMIQPPAWFIDGKSADTRLPVIIPSSREPDKNNKS